VSKGQPNPILLVTGFEPFASFDSNPSWDAAAEASTRLPESVAALRLPVDYFESRARLIAAIENLNPSACLCMGLAPTDEFRMEEVARKPKEFARLAGLPLMTGTWPWTNTLNALRSQDVPHRRSRDAGQYVCESTYWSLLDFGSRHSPEMHMGFLHVPAISKQFSLERTTQVVFAVISAYTSEILSQRSFV
jgi:pyroglutamyl-peptidase